VEVNWGILGLGRGKANLGYHSTLQVLQLTWAKDNDGGGEGGEGVPVKRKERLKQATNHGSTRLKWVGFSSSKPFWIRNLPSAQRYRASLCYCRLTVDSLASDLGVGLLGFANFVVGGPLPWALEKGVCSGKSQAAG